MVYQGKGPRQNSARVSEEKYLTPKISDNILNCQKICASSVRLTDSGFLRMLYNVRQPGFEPSKKVPTWALLADYRQPLCQKLIVRNFCFKILVIKSQGARSCLLWRRILLYQWIFALRTFKFTSTTQRVKLTSEIFIH